MSAVKTKQEAYEEAVLNYFNRILREKGIITEEEYRAMKRKISQRR